MKRKALITSIAFALVIGIPLGDLHAVTHAMESASPTANAAQPPAPADLVVEPGPILIPLDSRTATKAPLAAQKFKEAPKGETLHRLWEDKKHIAITGRSESYDPGKNTISSTDDVTHDECAANSGGAHKFWFKNRFGVCYIQEIGVLFLNANTGAIEGTDWYEMNIIGNVTSGEQNLRFSTRLRFLRTLGITNSSGSMAIRFTCDNRDTTRTSKCRSSADDPNLRNGYPMTFWKSIGSKTFEFSVGTSTTAVPSNDLYAAELRGFFSYQFHVSTILPGATPKEYPVAPEYFRCDSAIYVYNTNGKCVFQHVIPSLQMSATHPTMGLSASFIRDAQNGTGGRVEPNIPGKKVPGKFNEDPLHRLYHAYDVTRTGPSSWKGRRIQASRRKINRVCRQEWGANWRKGPNNTVLECDEYPFATTYENSALVYDDGPYSYAVRPVQREHNGAAGNFYGQWMSSDRILDSDPFYVIITP